ncbi:MAG TPA: Gfo/Idh/MocA family oxidoreductase, partial [Vicinamibacterales bacterium]|nr:Gfo/Idh/MocA family oxidoreductase [Vicinamibacterales bacterium]
MRAVQLEEPWKVGILGAGVVTSGSHLPVLVNMPDVSVKWVCDRSLPRAQSVARSYGIAQACADIAECPDVDVVLIATPVGSRRSIVPQVLARGWHAFCEKPFALTVADHESYVSDARTRGLQIGVAQVRRFARPTASARALLRHDALGPIQRVMAADGFRMRGTGRGGGWHLNDRAAGGGVLGEFGSHLIDQVLYILGATSASVRECTLRVHRGLDLAASVVADISRAASPPITCSMDVSLLDDLCNGVYIEFASGMLRVGLGFEDTLTLVSKDGTPISDFAMSEGADSPVQGFYLEWKDFLRQCATGKPSLVDAASVATTTAVIDEASRIRGD